MIFGGVPYHQKQDYVMQGKGGKKYILQLFLENQLIKVK